MPSIHPRPPQGAVFQSSDQIFRSFSKIQSPPRYLSAAAGSTHLAPLRITYTTNPREIDVAELADLMHRCATHSPGHATNAAEFTLDSPSTLAEEDELELEKKEQSRRFRRRLRRALKNSLVCIAAYVPEASLPEHLHRSFRNLPPDTKNNLPQFSFIVPCLWRLAPGMFPGPKVLVGFARAVGDAALVATVHDIVVLPEMRGKGLGKILVEKLTDQLYARDIIDVGTVISDEDIEYFLRRCYFGEDSEDSIAMALTESGKSSWILDGEKLVEQILNKKRVVKKNGGIGGAKKTSEAALREKNTSAV